MCTMHTMLYRRLKVFSKMRHMSVQQQLHSKFV